jgi:hypothetical protein
VSGNDNRAVLNFQIANSIVFKNQPFGFGMSLAGFSNETDEQEAFLFRNVGLVIPPLVRYRATVQVEQAIDPEEFEFVGLRIEGTAILLRLGQL